jgi:hypothetical protein
MNMRIKAYLAAVDDAKKADMSDGDGFNAAHNASRQAYLNLTRRDCAEIWHPDCPEAKDETRRP